MVVGHGVEPFAHEKFYQQDGVAQIYCFQANLVTSMVFQVLAGVFDGVGIIVACLGAVVLCLMDHLPDLLLLIDYRNSKLNNALISFSAEDTELGLKGLFDLGGTLSGESSALKHFLLEWEVSSRRMEWAGRRRQRRIISVDDGFIRILYQNYIMKQIPLKLNALIHKVKLQVRFPCSVTALLKIQAEETTFGQEVPLRMGEAVFQMAAAQQFTVQFDSVRNQLQEKKISILLFLKSASGRIPAGAAIISLNYIRKGNNRISVPVEKCPDKQAYIEMTVTCEGLNQLENIPSLQSLGSQNMESQDFQGRMSFGTRTHKSPTGSIREHIPTSGRNLGTDQKDKSLDGSKQLEKNSPQGFKYQAKRPFGSGQKEPQNSPGSPNYVQYNSRSKIHELQRQLKNVQKKYDQQNLQLKSITAKKEMTERALKQNQGQLKIIKQKYEDIHAQYDILQKKSEYKDSTLKEQLKNLTEKLSSSQSQKQKLIFEKNDMVNDFEEREKTLRLTLREKQKLVSDDKLKVSKKLQQITNQFNQFKLSCGDWSGKVDEVTKDLKIQKSKSQQLQNAKSLLAQQVSQLKEQLAQQNVRRKQLEETIGSNSELEEEKKKFKKKISQLQQEITNQLKNNAISQANSQKHTRRIQQLQATLKQKVASLKSSQKDGESFTKQIQNLKITISQRDKRAEQFSNMKQKQIHKMDNAMKQLQANIKKLQDELRTANRQIKQKDNVIRGLHEQMENDHGDIDSANKRIYELQSQLSDLRTSHNKLQFKYEDTLNLKEAVEADKLEYQTQLDAYVQQLDNKERQYKMLVNQSEEQTKRLEAQIKNLQYRVANSNEQSAFHIKQMQRKIEQLIKQSALKSQQLQELQKYSEKLQQDKSKQTTANQQLEYSIKMKQNEILFLKESNQKANQQISNSMGEIKQLSIQIQTLKRHIEGLEKDLQSANHQLEIANSSGSNTKYQLEQYKSKNNQHISNFLKSVKGGIIQTVPQHSQGSLVSLMREAININNKFVIQKQDRIKELQNLIAQWQKSHNSLQAELEEKVNEINFLSDSLNEEQSKNSNLNESSASAITKLNSEVNHLKSECTNLKDQLEILGQVQGNTAKELQETADRLSQELKKNQDLNKKLKALQQSFNKQKDQLINKSSFQTSKLTGQLTKLEAKFTDLQAKNQQKTKRCSQLEAQTIDLNKQVRQLTNKSNSDTKSLSGQISQLQADIQKKRKQIEAKGATIIRYGQIQKKLRDEVGQLTKQNQALKDLNQGFRTKNLKSTTREKQLQQQLSSLKDSYANLIKKESTVQRQYKQTLTELTSLKQKFYNLDNQKKKLKIEFDIAGATIKVKQDTASKQQASIKNLETQVSNLKTKLAANEKGSDQREVNLRKQLKQLQHQLQNERKTSNAQIERLTRLSDDLTRLKQQVQERLVNLSKAIDNKEKSQQIEAEFLKPIRENLMFLKGHMNEYARVGDQFQSNKNKLLKLATSKLEQYTDKNVADKLREVGLSFQRLKAFILAGSGLNETQKVNMSEEMKKVQQTLDRALRGSR